MRSFAISGFLALVFLLFFHFVPSAFTAFPKEFPSFANTFIDVGDYVKGYNEADLITKVAMRQSYIFRTLKQKGLVQSSDPNAAPTTQKGEPIPPRENSTAKPPLSAPTSAKSSELPAENPSRAFTNNFSDDDFAELKSVLANRLANCPNPGPCDIKGFTLEPTDLNGDGKQEFIVTHARYTGSGGATTVLMSENADRSWIPLASVFGSLKIESSSNKGYRDVRLDGQRYSWSGQEYLANGRPTVEK